MRVSVQLVASVLALTLAGVAQANTQTIVDPDDGATVVEGYQLDVRGAELAQGNGETWVDVTVESPSQWELDSVWTLFDTDFDGDADYVAKLTGFKESPATLTVHPTKDSTATCQQLGAEVYRDDAVAVTPGTPVPLHLPTSAIGGVASYRWAVYAITFSFSHSSFDHAPDATNPSPGRPNPAAPNPDDGCDDNGDGVYGGTGDRQSGYDQAIPVKMAGGTAYPAEPQAQQGGGQQGGGQQGGSAGGVGPNTPALPDPLLVAIPAPRTLKTITMPDLRPGSAICRGGLCSLDRAKRALAAAGLSTYALLLREAESDHIPKKLRKQAEHNDVGAQQPAPGEKVALPNFLAYPGSKLPSVRLYLHVEPQLKYDCDQAGLADVLKDAAWPGVTKKSGVNRFGAQDILRKLKCDYRWKYLPKDAKVTEPRIASVKIGGEVRLKVTQPKTTEFNVQPIEGAKELPEIAGKKLVGLDAEGRMPVADKGEGMFAVRVLETSVIPNRTAPAGVGVVVYGPDNGGAVATGRTDRNGLAVLRGNFHRLGTYRISAMLETTNGATMDGEGSLRVAVVSSNLTTESGRRFKLAKGRWELQAPKAVPARRRDEADDFLNGAECPDLPREEPGRAVRIGVANLRDDLGALAKARTSGERAQATALFINTYLLLQKHGLLAYAPVQDFLNQVDISVPNLGAGKLTPTGSLCVQRFAEIARHLARGLDLNSPLPVISTRRGMQLTNGTAFDAKVSLTTGALALAPSIPLVKLLLEPGEQATLVQAWIAATGNAELARLLGDALSGIFVVGTNVISTGGGNWISTNTGNLSVPQLKMLFSVIATGGGNVISTGGGNLTAAERAAVETIRRVISTGGGNLIGQAGGNLTDTQIKGLLRVIATGGGNLISDNGGGLTSAEVGALNAVIATGGGNLVPLEMLRQSVYGVISTGGGNVISTGGGNAQQDATAKNSVNLVDAVISTGGGNLIAFDPNAAKDLIAKFVGAVISTGGGNVISTGGGNLKADIARIGQVISTGGGNLISDKGLGLIGQAGGNVIATGGGNIN